MYDGWDVIREDHSVKGVTLYQNGLGIDDKLRSKNGTTVRYFLTDHLGSTEGLADASGAIVSSTSYDSFGNATSNIATSYRYTGREYDADIGLYYYRNRWYNPKIGRFISKDPIGFAGGDINLYGYVWNSPYSFIDPFGFQGCPFRGSAFGLLDAFQGLLDLGGLIPAIGLPLDLASAGISYARGNYADAALSMSAAVPFAGAIAGLAKIAKTAKKLVKKVTKKLKRSPKFSKYEDVTERGSRWPNKETDVSMDDFIDNLTKQGYVRKLSSDGKVDILTKGNKKYSVRPFSRSTDGPTADYSVNERKKLKIRLDQ